MQKPTIVYSLYDMYMNMIERGLSKAPVDEGLREVSLRINPMKDCKNNICNHIEYLFTITELISDLIDEGYIVDFNFTELEMTDCFDFTLVEEPIYTITVKELAEE